MAVPEEGTIGREVGRAGIPCQRESGGTQGLEMDLCARSVAVGRREGMRVNKD